MSLKEKYQIDDATWAKLKSFFLIGILLGIPFISGCTAFMTWPILDGFSWTLPILLTGALFYICFLFHIARILYEVNILFLSCFA
jgi:hypothetical protein